MADKVSSHGDNTDESELLSVQKKISETSLQADASANEDEKDERKITQTDHLNKKLLGAFLSRLNTNDNSVAFAANKPEGDERKEDNFETATNSGKTTTMRKLCATFPSSTTMCQDSYFLDPCDERLEIVPQRDHANWEKLSAMDMKSMVNHVHKWIQYQQTKGSNSPSFLFIDGFLIYNYSPLAELFDRKYFLTIDKETCKDRRSGRVYVPADPPWYFEEVVWPMYKQNLEEIRAQNDICFLSGAQDQEKLVNTLKEDIHKFLKKNSS